MKPSQTANQLYSEAADQFAYAMQRLARATEAHAERRRDLLQDMHVQLWRSLEHLWDNRASQEPHLPSGGDHVLFGLKCLFVILKEKPV